MTTEPAPAALSTTDRRISIFVVMVVIAVLAGGFGAALHVPPTLPPMPMVGWRLADGFPVGPKFDPSQVRTMTDVPIDVDWLLCGPSQLTWSMLAAPQVSYTLRSVIITMHFNDPTGILNKCVDSGQVGIMLDTGLSVMVHLDSPLGGRKLLDGSTDPPKVEVYH